MCLNTWSFKPVNVDKISCTNCVLRWTWEGQHISSTNPEMFENCIDVTINPDSSSNSGDSAKYGKKQQKASPKNSPDSGSNSAASSEVSDSAKRREILPEPDSNLTGSTSTQRKESKKSPARSECACDLSIDADIYSQCTADGNYCTCFRGPYSALGNVKMNCAPGTKCSQSGSQIHCQ
jgi:hypothetical protein